MERKAQGLAVKAFGKNEGLHLVTVEVQVQHRDGTQSLRGLGRGSTADSHNFGTFCGQAGASVLMSVV